MKYKKELKNKKEQKSAINNIERFYKVRNIVTEIFNNNSLIMSEVKHK